MQIYIYETGYCIYNCINCVLEIAAGDDSKEDCIIIIIHRIDLYDLKKFLIEISL